MFSRPSQDPEERAYMLLQWASRAPLAPFNAELADAGFYTRVQRASSDQAVKAWDAAKPADTSSELQAFRELERLGQITQADYFSPGKAAEGIYSSTLKVYRSAQRITRQAADVSRADGAGREQRLAEPRRAERTETQSSDQGRSVSTRPADRSRDGRKRGVGGRKKGQRAK